MRIILTIVLPLVLPTLVYFAYMAAKREERPGGPPWFWLAVTGLVLTAATLGLFAIFGGAEPGSVYHPPRQVNGHIESGRFGE